MINKKILFAFCFVICIFSAVSGVAAGDMNETAIANDVIADGNDVILATENLDDSSSDIENEVQTNNDSIVNCGDNVLTSTERNISSDSMINAQIIPVNTVGEYKAGRATFKLVDADKNVPLANRNLKLTIKSQSIDSAYTSKTDSNGIATFNYEDMYCFDNVDGSLNMFPLAVGVRSVVLNVDNEADLNVQELMTTLTVYQASVKITIGEGDNHYNQNDNLTVKVVNAGNGVALKSEVFKFQVSYTPYYAITDSEGTFKIILKNLIPGYYALTVSPNETSNIKSVSISDNFFVQGQASISISQSGTNCANKKLTVKLVSSTTNKAIEYENIRISFSNGVNKKVVTNANGVATCRLSFNPGTYSVSASLSSDYYTAADVSLKGIKISKAPVKIMASKVTTTYKSGKKFSVTLKDATTNNALSNAKVTIKVYTGSSSRTYQRTTNSNGVATFNDASKLTPGNHKVVVSYSSTKYAKNSITTSIVVNKIALKIITIAKKYTKCGEVHIKVRDGSKFVNGIKLNLKVFTGSSYKPYDIVTGYDKKVYKSNGIALISSNAFSVGNHLVKISVVSPYYKGTASAYLTIPSSSKKYPIYTGVMSQGKLIKYVG